MRIIFENWRLLFLIGLMAVGLGVGVWQPVELATALAWGERIAGHPLAMAGVVVLMALMLTFALPGTFILWLIAPFHSPAVSTGLLLAGSITGALGAYGVAARLGRDWQPKGLSAQVMALLARRSDALTQCALRVLPGFPHSVVNYAAGVLRLRPATFVVAAVAGLTIKWSVYSIAIRGAVTAVEGGEKVNPRTLLGLAALAVLLLIGAWARRRLERPPRNGPEGREVA